MGEPYTHSSILKFLNGLFEVKTGVVKSAFRDIQTFTTKITPKGQLYFYNKIQFLKKFMYNFFHI